MRVNRITFPGDEVLKNAHEIKITLVKVQGTIALHYEIHGNVNDPFTKRFVEGDDDDECDLLDEKSATDPQELARMLLGVMQPAKGGAA